MTGRILIAGIGDVLKRDDGIGPYCIALLRARVKLPDHVVLADHGSVGLELPRHLSTADHVIAIDALRGVQPGSLHVVNRVSAPIDGCDPRLDTHAPSFEASIQIARLSGGRPHDATLVGLGGACFDHGTGFSEVVRTQINALAALVLEQLTMLGVSWQRRNPPAPIDPWWDDEAGVAARRA